MSPDFTILYVADVPASAGFYAALLGQLPAEASPGFAMFVLPGGHKLGLWKREAVLPAVTAAPGAAELTFVVADLAATLATWQAKGVRMVQSPARLEFGETCCGLDPDGHRLRALVPAG